MRRQQALIGAARSLGVSLLSNAACHALLGASAPRWWSSRTRMQRDSLAAAWLFYGFECRALAGGRQPRAVRRRQSTTELAEPQNHSAIPRVPRWASSLRRLEREPGAEPRDARVHDFEDVAEAGWTGQARVVLLAEDRSGVEHVEHVEVEVHVRAAEREPLLDARVERGDRGQPELADFADQQHVLAAQRVAGGDVALEERFGIALARDEVATEVDAP